MKRSITAISAIACLFIFASAFRNEKKLLPATGISVTVTTTAVDFTSSNGVTVRYVVTGLDKTTGIQHGGCINVSSNPEINKNGSVLGIGVCGITDGKGRSAPPHTFYCSAYTSNLKSKTTYYAKAYVKLGDGTIIYGNEKSFTMK